MAALSRGHDSRLAVEEKATFVDRLMSIDQLLLGVGNYANELTAISFNGRYLKLPQHRLRHLLWMPGEGHSDNAATIIAARRNVL